MDLCRDEAYDVYDHVHVRYMLSPVCLSSVCLSVTFVRCTQTVKIFGNLSTALGTLATR